MMWRCSGTVLLLVLSFARSEVTDINQDVETVLKRRNLVAMVTDDAAYEIGKLDLPDISITSGLLVGRDSLVRTGHCTLNNVRVSNYTYDLHIGYELLSVGLSGMTVTGVDASGVFIVLNNSVQLTFTVHHDDVNNPCFVTADRMRYTDFSDVIFRVSRPGLWPPEQVLGRLLQESLVDRLNSNLESVRTDPKFTTGLLDICEYEDDKIKIIDRIIQIFLKYS